MSTKKIFYHFRRLNIFLMIVVLIFCITNFSFAQSLRYNVSKGEYQRKDSERVSIVGKIINIAYELQHRPSGANSQDSLFSKGRQGLLTSGGVMWTFIDNVKGQDLQWNKRYLGKFVKIDGWVFHDAQYIEIDTFSMDGQDYQWSNKTNSFQPVKNNEE